MPQRGIPAQVNSTGNVGKELRRFAGAHLGWKRIPLNQNTHQFRIRNDIPGDKERKLCSVKGRDDIEKNNWSNLVE